MFEKIVIGLTLIVAFFFHGPALFLTILAGGVLFMGLLDSLKASVRAGVTQGLPTSPSPAPAAPPVGSVPAEHLPLLPWEPLTAAGRDYRERQLAYRRANGLPLADA